MEPTPGGGSNLPRLVGITSLLAWVASGVVMITVGSALPGSPAGAISIGVWILLAFIVGIAIFWFATQRNAELAHGYGYLPSDPLTADQVDRRSGVVIRDAGSPRLTSEQYRLRVKSARAWARTHPQQPAGVPAAPNQQNGAGSRVDAQGVAGGQAFRRVAPIDGGRSTIWRSIGTWLAALWFVSLAGMGFGLMFRPFTSAGLVLYIGNVVLACILLIAVLVTLGVFNSQRRREMARGYGYLPDDPAALDEVDSRSGVVIRSAGQSHLSKIDRAVRVRAAREWAAAHPPGEESTEHAARSAPIASPAPLDLSETGARLGGVERLPPTVGLAAVEEPSVDDGDSPAHGSQRPGQRRTRYRSWIAAPILVLGLVMAGRAATGFAQDPESGAFLSTVIVLGALIVVGFVMLWVSGATQRRTAQALARGTDPAPALPGRATAHPLADRSGRAVTLNTLACDDTAPGLLLVRRHRGMPPPPQLPRRLVFVADARGIEFWDADGTAVLDAVPADMITGVHTELIDDPTGPALPPTGIALAITVPGSLAVTVRLIVLGDAAAILAMRSAEVELYATRLRAALHPREGTP